MTWFKIDDGFYDHPKVEMLPDAAVALWVRAGSYCGKHLTDGVIPGRVARRFCDDPDKGIRALIEAGLWLPLDADEKPVSGVITQAISYRFHDWSDFNPKRSEAIKERSKKSEGAILANHHRWHIDKGKYSQDCKHCVAMKTQSTDQGSDQSSDQSSDQTRDQSPESSRPDPTLRDKPPSVPPSRGTNSRSASAAVIPGTGTDDGVVDNRQPGQRLIGYWCDLVAPMRPHKSTLAAAGKFLAECVKDGNVPEELLRECIDEFVASGKSGVNILRNIVDGRINKSAGHTRRDRARCPDHESYFQDNCPYH